MTEESYKSVAFEGMRLLQPEEFDQLARTREPIIIDARPAWYVGRTGFIPGSVNIGIGPEFTDLVKGLTNNIEKPILLVAETGREAEVVTMLKLAGLRNFLGYLADGIEAWKAAGKEVHYITRISASQFAMRRITGEKVIDVRTESDYARGHCSGASNFPLDRIISWAPGLEKNGSYTIYCEDGYRSMIAASVLKAKGFETIRIIIAGYRGIAATGLSATKQAALVKFPAWLVIFKLFSF